MYRDDIKSNSKMNGIARVWHSVRKFFRRFGRNKGTSASSEIKDDTENNQIESNDETEGSEARVIPCIDD